MSNDLLLRSSPGANLNDDAVFTPVGSQTNDHWFYDPNQGLGVEDVELSRDLQTVVGIAGFYDEKLRVYRTTMSPFGAPDWDHTPFTNQVRTSRSRSSATSCRGKFENTTLAPSGKAMAYSTAEGVFVAAIPDNCAPGGPGALIFPGAKHPDWGPADVPPASAFQTAGGASPRARDARPGGQEAQAGGHRAPARSPSPSRRRQGHGDRQAQAAHGRQAHQDGQGRRDADVQAQGPRQGHRHRDVQSKQTARQDAHAAGVELPA